MSHLIKIGHTFVNLDSVRFVEDRFASSKENAIVVWFGAQIEDSLTFSGTEADDLRTWLNSRAVNLREGGDPADLG